MNLLRILFIIHCSLFISLSSAEAQSNGYYRVLNTTTSRYLFVTSDKGKVDYNATDVDLGSLKTVKGFDKVVSAPGTVLYLEKTGSGKYSYTIRAQGTDTYAISGGSYLDISSNGDGSYKASGTKSGTTMYLVDETGTASEGIVMTGKKNSSTSNWYLVPVTTTDDACFGITPDVSVGGRHYAAFYASFPFSFLSSGMKAYYISRIVQGMAILSEWPSSVIPASMPVLISCSSTSPLSNKVNVGTPTNVAGPAVSLLRGVFFDNTNKILGHYTPYDANTMRVLGKNSNGELAFVKYSGAVVPANKAYLQVPAGSPDQLRIVTEEEYLALIGAPVTIKANDCTISYGDRMPEYSYTITEGIPLGVPSVSCAATSTSPAGTYPIVVSKGTVSNGNLTLVNGTLTINKAHVTFKVNNYTREQFEPNPEFQLLFTGFVAGESVDNLTTAPVISCEATPESPVGQYPITISLAESPNYDFTYIPGTLTVTPSTSITSIIYNLSPTIPIYTLSGQRVTPPLHPGIYIVGNRKVIIK